MPNVPAISLAAAIALGVGCGRQAAQGPDPPSAPVGPAGAVVTELPRPIDPDRRYLIYLHNQFQETATEGQEHPVFGRYEYRSILQAFAERRFAVLSEQREPRADPNRWADRVAAQVRALLEAGVPPERINVVGFSKGGAIAILVSARVAEPAVSYAFLAACGPWLESAQHLQPSGRLLSIRESSDDVAGSCQPLFDRASRDAQTREIELHLGGGHGAFFTARDEWIDPVVDWATGTMR